MTFTVSLPYFVDNQKQILRKIGFGMTVSALLDTQLYSISKQLVTQQTVADGEYIIIREKATGKLIHRFMLKDDNVCDMSCSEDCCECMVAVAIKFDWLKLRNETYPLSSWIPLGSSEIDDAQYKFRWVLRKGEIHCILRSRFLGKSVEMSVSVLQSLIDIMSIYTKKGKVSLHDKLFKLASKGKKSWLNLRQYKTLPVSKQLKKDLGIKIDFDEE